MNRIGVAVMGATLRRRDTSKLGATAPTGTLRDAGRRASANSDVDSVKLVSRPDSHRATGLGFRSGPGSPVWPGR